MRLASRRLATPDIESCNPAMQEYLWNYCNIAGIANKSTAIDRSIAEAQLDDRA